MSSMFLLGARASVYKRIGGVVQSLTHVDSLFDSLMKPIVPLPRKKNVEI